MVADARAQQCLTCGKSWPAHHFSCPDDGGRLVIPTATTNVVLKTSSFTMQDPNGFDTVIDLGGDAARFVAEMPRVTADSQTNELPTRPVQRMEGHIDLPPGAIVDEDYEIGGLLGAGAMGEVYAARHVKLGKKVAIKVISPRSSEDTETVERFVQEAKTLARMHHPGLVDVLGFGELSDGRAYFVMEYLSGESLFERMARGRIGHAEAIDIFQQIVRAIGAAHGHGVVHRDLKPENIYLVRVANDDRPVVKLLDFGLAKLAMEADMRAVRTERGVVLGTAMYLSPEQARGGNVDARTDIYALGCVAYELLVGRHPFKDERSVAAVIAAHLHNPPPMPRQIDPNIPPELDLMLFAMLAKDPNYRPTLAQIRAVLEGRGAPRRPSIAGPVPPPLAAQSQPLPVMGRTWDRRSIVIAILLLIIGIGVGALIRV